MSPSTDSTGVYFETRDCIGVGRRLLIDFVDTSVVIIACVLLTLLLLAVWPHERVVNLQGSRPSILSLLARLLFVAGGPANFLLDLFWIPSDPCRQAIRDKFAHTYVVRKNAVPAGSGRIVYRTYAMLGTTFLFQEVKLDRAGGAGTGRAAERTGR